MLRHELPGGLHLRLPDEADAEPLQATIERIREHLLPWMPWAEHQDLEGTRRWIRQARRRIGDNSGLELVIARRDEAIVGAVGTGDVQWRDRSVALGYWLAPEAQGRGTMTAAVGVLVEQAFTAWSLHRVEIRAAPGNHRSRAVAERLGFTAEGTLREVERAGDGWLDHVVYGMLSAEWATRG